MERERRILVKDFIGNKYKVGWLFGLRYRRSLNEIWIIIRLKVWVVSRMIMLVDRDEKG